MENDLIKPQSIEVVKYLRWKVKHYRCARANGDRGSFDLANQTQVELDMYLDWLNEIEAKGGS